MSGPDSPEVLQRFEDHLVMVTRIAKRMPIRLQQSFELDDLIAYGREGLLDAARRFDESRGVPFKAYATFRVRGAIIDGVRSMSRLPRRLHDQLRAAEAAATVSEGAVEDALAPEPPGSSRANAEQALSDHLGAMATAMALGLLASAAHDDEGQVTAVASDASPEDALGRAELMHTVTQAIEGLPEQEATLVRRHYLGGERFDHVAEDLGLSKSWASRLHTRAIKRLTKQLRNKT